MCILIWRGCFCVIDEAFDSNQLVIGAQLLNNAFIRPCGVFHGSPLLCKYAWSALMSLLWTSQGKWLISLCDILHNMPCLHWIVASENQLRRRFYKLSSWLLCPSPHEMERACQHIPILSSCFLCVFQLARLVTSCNNLRYLSAWRKRFSAATSSYCAAFSSL